MHAAPPFCANYLRTVTTAISKVYERYKFMLRMKRYKYRFPTRQVSVLLILCLLVGALCTTLTACTSGGNNTVDGKKITLTVWGAQEDQELLREMCDAYAKENPDKTYEFLFGVQGEGDAGDKILNDVMAGPDVYSFAGDRINTFYAGGALARIGGDIEAEVKATHTEGAVDAATIRVNNEDHLYAFPVTGDNTYFLYYDKSVYTDPADLADFDSLLDTAAAAGKKVHFKLNDDGWYLSSFFFADEDLKYDVTYNDRMVEEKVTINYDTEDGLDVMRALRHYVGHTALVAQTDDSKVIAAFTADAQGKREAAAAVSGTWNAATIKSLLGDNMGVCILPTVKIGGESVRLSGFMGYKLMGVNGYSQNKGEATRLAAYLTNEENQLKRFRARGLGPTNKTVSSLPEVLDDPVISTVLEQAAYNRSQKSVPSAYWTPMASLITPLITAKADGRTVTDAEMKGYLEALCNQIRKP